MKTVQISGVSVIICDIEGTTTPISFVKKILFGYINDHLQEFLDENMDKEWMDEFPKENLEKQIQSLMHQDSKVSWLKNFQGKMWSFGYESSVLKGQVYTDVLSNFKKWYQNFKIGIYSSGSIHAQKLLFKYSESGDLSSFLSFHFDTTNAGPKNNSESYKKISKELGVEPATILFLSDSILEIKAATEAGLKTCRVDRDNIFTSGNVVNNFDQLCVGTDTSRKRKIEYDIERKTKV